jgi:hypothetical protein
VSIEAPPGVVGAVAPSVFEILPGATQAVTLSLKRVRLPVTVQPVE